MTQKVYLNGKAGAGKYALVDDKDYELVSRYRWFLNQDGYAISGRKRRSDKSILMHRMVMNTPTGMLTDHKNQDKLDNRRENLRICNTSENNRNMRPGARGGSSRFTGVYFCKTRKLWVAMIKGESKRYNLGRFATEIEAALAYDRKAYELHGEYFSPNLPFQPSLIDAQEPMHPPR